MSEHYPHLPPPEGKGFKSRTAQLGIVGALLVGMFDQPLLLLIICGAMMFFGEVLRLSFRDGPLSARALFGLTITSAVFAFVSYGLGRVETGGLPQHQVIC